MNPAVSLALAASRKLPWKKLPMYLLAQYLGSLAASLTVLGIYYGNTSECHADDTCFTITSHVWRCRLDNAQARRGVQWRIPHCAERDRSRLRCHLRQLSGFERHYRHRPVRRGKRDTRRAKAQDLKGIPRFWRRRFSWSSSSL